MQNVISVPVSALIEEQGVYSVFVRVHEEAYKKVPVTLGADNGSEVQILSGLNAGDEVVTVGAYQIKLASASNAIPEMCIRDSFRAAATFAILATTSVSPAVSDCN